MAIFDYYLVDITCDVLGVVAVDVVKKYLNENIQI